jgi:hypothetical protein
MVWREPKPIVQLLLCLTKVTGITSKTKHPVKYPDLPSAMRPCPHSEKLPVPKPPENLNFGDENSDSGKENAQQERNNVDCDPTFVVHCSSSETHSLTQRNLNDLVRDLNSTLRFQTKSTEYSPPRY